MTDDCLYSSLSDRPGDIVGVSQRKSLLANWRDVLVPFLASRAVLLLIGIIAMRLLSQFCQAPDSLAPFSHFDERWYLRIARDGYFFDPSRESSIAFAPLLPMLMRVIGLALGGSDAAYEIAGVIIANTALIAALLFIRAMAEELYGERAARRTVLYVLICPGTLFLSAAYPMSLMLAIGAGAIWYARKGRWELASAIAMLAPLARPDGILLLFPLLVEAVKARDKDPRRLWLLMVPAMSAIWLAGQWMAFGTPLAFVHAQKMWQSTAFTVVLHSSRAPLILGIAGLFLLLTLLGLCSLPVTLSLYSTLFLGVMLFSGRPWSLPRFVVILFPCFITLGCLGARRKWLHIFYVIGSTLIAAIFMLRFSLWLWVA